MRVRLALLLSLLMVFQSAMGALALMPVCPMPAQEMAAHAMHSSMHMDETSGMHEVDATNADHQCCQDAAPTSTGGQLCDDHESCCSCGFTALPSLQALPPPLQANGTWSDVPARCLPRDPANVWRPPLFS